MLELESFTPQGHAASVRQLRARFQSAVAPLGDSSAVEDPFEVNCPYKGKGRWVDTFTWVYDFEEELPGGVRCSARPVAIFSDSSLSELSFNTGGVKVEKSDPGPGSWRISEKQNFLLAFNGPVNKQSLRTHAFALVEGLENPIPLTVLSDTVAQKLAKESYRFRGTPIDRLLAVRAQQSFPSGKIVTLNFGEGVESAMGLKSQSPQSLRYKVRDELSFDYSCRRPKEDANCSPLSDIVFNFSEPVPGEVLERITLSDDEGNKLVFSISEWEKKRGEIQNLRINGPHKEDSKYIVRIEGQVRDLDGRALSNSESFPLEIAVGSFPPLAKFASSFGVVEFLDGEAQLPLTIRRLDENLQTKIRPSIGVEPGWFDRILGRHEAFGPDQIKDIVHWLQAVDRASSDYKLNAQSVFEARREPQSGASLSAETKVQEIEVPRSGEARDFEVVALPIKQPGFYVYELESKNLSEAYRNENQSAFVPTSVLATGLAVHMKLGSANGLVWVTSLQKAEVVSAAKVSIVDCNGASIWAGETDSNGVAMIEDFQLVSEARSRCEDIGEDSREDMENDTEWARTAGQYEQGLFAFAEKDGDLSFAHSSWNKGLEMWRFGYNRYSDVSKKFTAHTVTDRKVYLPEDTVEMKTFVRESSLLGLKIPEKIPFSQMRVLHEASSKEFTLQSEWDGSGTALNTWKIPRGAPLGDYSVYLSLSEEDSLWQSLRLAQFQVEEVKLPLTTGWLKGKKRVTMQGEDVPLTGFVRFLSGGTASGMNVQVETLIERSWSAYTPSVLTDFRWNSGPADTSKQRTIAQNVSQKQELELDKAGTASWRVKDIPEVDQTLRLNAELSYKDPNGEFKTLRWGQHLHPSALQVGIKKERWMPVDGALSAEVAVLDLMDKAVAGQKVQVRQIQRNVISHRRKGVGGTYSYVNKTEYLDKGVLCAGTTDSNGLFRCEGQSSESGNIYLQAEVEDKNGRKSFSTVSVWIPGGDDWWFSQSNGDRMDVLAEKESYEVGESGRFQVKMPFQNATALVTVEREGVLDSKVVKLSGKGPVVEVPMKGLYGPNVFVGVLALRGRLNKPKPTAIVDLGKPSFKIGAAEVEVGWEEHKLDVRVSTPKKVYKTREIVPLTVSISKSQMSRIGSTREVDVLVLGVDEASFVLKDNDSWKLLDAMMKKRNNDVKTATAQMQVVGKRHFGLKALPVGGDGGMLEESAESLAKTLSEESGVRRNFHPLLLWQGKVTLDENGKAVVDVPLNDSLSEFRLGAVVASGDSLFGTATTKVRATQDVTVYSGVPLVLRAGDITQAEYTLRNTTENTLKVGLDFELWNPSVLPPLNPLVSHSSEKIELAAGESQVVRFDVEAPVQLSQIDSGKLSYILRVSDSVGNQIDAVEVDQSLLGVHKARVLMSELRQVSQSEQGSLDLAAVPGALKEGASINFSSAASLDSALLEVKNYMSSYPYNCLEQRLSKAIVANDTELFELWLSDLDAHRDGRGLLKFFKSESEGSPVLTAYVLRILGAHKTWEIPEDSLTPLVEGLKSVLTGRSLQAERLDRRSSLLALEALALHQQLPKDSLSLLDADYTIWDNSELLSLRSIHAISGDSQAAQETLTVLEGRIQEEGSVLSLAHYQAERSWFYMENRSMDHILFLYSLMKWPTQRFENSRKLKLLRAILAMQERGHWGLTTSNAWGSVAIEAAAESFELASVSGLTEFELKEEVEGSLQVKDQRKIDLSPAHSATVASGHRMKWDPTQAAVLNYTHLGKGSPLVNVSVSAALELNELKERGVRYSKEFAVRRIGESGSLKFVPSLQELSLEAGDVVYVRVKVSPSGESNWMVLDDPVPAGATLLGKGLGGESQLSQRLWTRTETASRVRVPTYVERRADRFVAYLKNVKREEFWIEYSYRINHEGHFQMPNTRIEALYFPEMNAEGPNAEIQVGN